MPEAEVPCPRCGVPHGGIMRCPHVKAVELEHGGDFTSIKRVEFLTPADYPAPVVQPKPEEPPAPSYPRKGAS